MIQLFERGIRGGLTFVNSNSTIIKMGTLTWPILIKLIYMGQVYTGLCLIQNFLGWTKMSYKDFPIPNKSLIWMMKGITASAICLKLILSIHKNYTKHQQTFLWHRIMIT